LGSSQHEHFHKQFYLGSSQREHFYMQFYLDYSQCEYFYSQAVLLGLQSTWTFLQAVLHFIWYPKKNLVYSRIEVWVNLVWSKAKLSGGIEVIFLLIVNEMS
jgi:hypothetical protein